MLSSIEFFKDEALQGVSRAIKELHQMQAEADTQKLDKFGITNHNKHFKNLLHYIDAALSLGLVEPKKGYWPFVKRFCHRTTIQMVQSHHDAANDLKRGQIWLFLTFMESSLQSYMKSMRNDEKELKSFYKKYALLRDTERCTIFEQLIIGLEMVVFVLDFKFPLVSYVREPLFKPTEFFASRKTSIPSKLSGKATSGTQTPPDVAINATGIENPVTPDLLRGNVTGKDGFFDQQQKDCDDELVTHLRTKRRVDTLRKKPKKRFDSEGSASVSNELEEDNYIPEFQDSLPLTVVVPDEPDSIDAAIASGKSNADLDDEHVYTEFLFGMGIPEVEGNLQNDSGTGLSLNQEISSSIVGNKDDDPRVASPETKEQVDEHFDEMNQAVALASSVHSEGAYRITYVTDDDDDDVVDDNLHQTRNQLRSLSLDSFDKFCRSGSMSKEEKQKSTNANEDGDDDDDDNGFVRRELNTVSPPADEIEESTLPPTSSIDISFESEAITTSPIGNKLPRESMDRVFGARFDTSLGILLPTLPRRPTFSDACDVYQDLNIDQNKIVLLSLELFEDSEEVLKKMYKVYVGYLYGIRREVSVAVTNLNVYILSRDVKKDCEYSKELRIPVDSINRIQSGLNMQDVIISHDDGKVQLWTGEEVFTKNICSAFSSSLRKNNEKTVSVEQMKVDVHKDLELIIKDWIMFVENTEEPEVLHFALVEFHTLNAEQPEPKIMKNGVLQKKLSYLGMVPYWEKSIFGLRGSSLYEYSAKGNHELKQVLDISKRCGGCVKIKSTEKMYGFKVLASDGATVLLELAAESDEDANDWIVNICQVVADSIRSPNNNISQYTEGVVPRALLLSSKKVYVFIQNSRNRRLSLIDSCMIQDILQICVDNEDRSYCILQIDDSIGSSTDAAKRSWILKFQSEYELGKFEQKIFALWHSLYQVPLQFVLLADSDFKKSVRRYLAFGEQDACASVEDIGLSVVQMSCT